MSKHINKRIGLCTINATCAQCLLLSCIPFGAMEFVSSLIPWGHSLIFVQFSDRESWEQWKH